VSRETPIAEAEVAVRIAAAETTPTEAVDEMIRTEAVAGMIPIAVIGTAGLIDVAILIVDQPIRQAAESAAVTAMAAATGATERQLIPARLIRREPPIPTVAEIVIQIAAAVEIVAGTEIEIATKIKVRTRIEIGVRIETKTVTRTRTGIETKTVTGAKIGTRIEIGKRAGIVAKTATAIVTKTPGEDTTVIAIRTIRPTSTPPSMMSGTIIVTPTARALTSADIGMACTPVPMTPGAARATIRSARTSLRVPREDITQPTDSVRLISKLIATASWLVTMKAIVTGRGISQGAFLPDIRNRASNYLEGRGQTWPRLFLFTAFSAFHFVDQLRPNARYRAACRLAGQSD